MSFVKSSLARNDYWVPIQEKVVRGAKNDQIYSRKKILLSFSIYTLIFNRKNDFRTKRKGMVLRCSKLSGRLLTLIYQNKDVNLEE